MMIDVVTTALLGCYPSAEQLMDRYVHVSYGICPQCGKLHSSAAMCPGGPAWDTNVIDLPPDAVREVRTVPLLGVDVGVRDRTSVCAARGHADGTVEVIGICEFFDDADSDGGECD